MGNRDGLLVRVPFGIVAYLFGLGFLALASTVSSAESDALPKDVHINTTDAGHYIMAAGQSLYWNDKDVSAAEATCIEECLETWRPLAPAADAEDIGHWSIVGRPDGLQQWTYRDKPVYTYVKDSFPGARLGDGQRRIWHLLFEPLEVPAGMSIESSLLGLVLADHRGRTLYTNAQLPLPTGTEPFANASHWQMFTAPWLAVSQGDWTIQSHPGGIRQWAYQGRSLFTFEKDTDPQQIRGHGLDDAWSAVVLEAAPGLPSWMTIQMVDAGLAYADEQGMTLYAPVDIERIVVAQTCPAECMQKYWRPILAKPEESSIGRWVILENEAGQRQWSYAGRFVYTHTRDTKPGEMVGNGYAVGYSIGDGWRIILVESGLRPARS